MLPNKYAKYNILFAWSHVIQIILARYIVTNTFYDLFRHTYISPDFHMKRAVNVTKNLLFKLTNSKLPYYFSYHLPNKSVRDHLKFKAFMSFQRAY